MVIGVSGHQDIPASASIYIERSLDAHISSLADLVGVCSLAAGGDQLFAESILRRWGALKVVVPCKGYETTFSKKADLDRYARLLKKANEIITLDYPEPSEEAYFAAGKRVVDMADELIAIWDGKRARGHGGTADVVNYARNGHKQITVIWPEGVER
jgi:hypothetical protein